VANEGVTIEVLAERLKGVQEDVADLRQQRRDDHHRLRSVEAAVTAMVDAQKAARESERRQYQRLGTKIAVGGLSISLGLLVLAAVTLAIHAH